MTQEELTKVFKYIVKKCDMLINNGNYEADAYTQDTVEDIAELCNHILDGDYGKLVEVKEVQEEPVSEDLEEAIEKSFIYHESRGDDFRSDKQIETAYRYGFETGAKWKEEQFEKDCADLCNGIATAKGLAVTMAYDKGVADAREQMIKKFYDWLRSNVTYIHPRKGTEECITTLGKLKQAMKDE